MRQGKGKTKKGILSQRAPPSVSLMPKCLVNQGQDTSSETPETSPRPTSPGSHLFIIAAAAAGNMVEVSYLLDAKVSASASDYDRRSALHLAVAEGNYDVADLLLRHQADPNFKDRWHNSPLDEARRLKLETTATLLQHHGGVSEESSEDTSVFLIAAAAKGDLLKVKHLLEDRADPNAKDYDRRTALHLAVAEQQYPVIELLLSKDASILVEDRWGSTPLSEAMRIGNATIQALLQKFAPSDLEFPIPVANSSSAGPIDSDGSSVTQSLSEFNLGRAPPSTTALRLDPNSVVSKKDEAPQQPQTLLPDLCRSS